MVEKFKQLKNSQMPVVGFGTWQITGSQATDAILSAYEMGYRHIDTAEMYGNEKEIGEALKQLDRSKLFITSKVWMSNFAPDDLKKAAQQSLDKLATDYLDLYLLHWPKEGTDYKETFKALKQLVDDGKIKHVGVSNFTVSHLKKILPIAKEAGVNIAVNQVEFHPGLYQKELLEFCTQRGIVLTAYSPIAQGKVFEYPELSDIAKNHSKSESQVALRWLLHKGLVVIPRSKNPEHQKANIELFGFELSADEIAIIDNIGAGDRIINPSFAEFDD